MAFGSSKTSCYLGCQQFSNLWIFVCWLVFCLGFFPLDHCQDGLECLNVASCLSFCFFFCFFFNLFFAVEVKGHPEALQAGEEWVSMGTGMPLGAQGFHGCAPTNYNSKAPVENFKTVFSFTDCLLDASPILSPCFASINREGLVFQERTVCALKK